MITQKRKQLRLKNYDYRQAGVYFVTLCTFEKLSMFGKIIDKKMILNDLGKIVQDEWIKTANIRTHVSLDEFVIMPNHIHGIIIINKNDVGATRRVALMGLQSGSVGAIIGQFKSSVTKRINEHRNTPGRYVWQRNYYDHIIRNDADLNRIRQYITNNPKQWDIDEHNQKFI